MSNQRHIVVVDSSGEFLQDVLVESPIPLNITIKHYGRPCRAAYNVLLDVYKISKPICSICGVAPCRTPGACNAAARFDAAGTGE